MFPRKRDRSWNHQEGRGYLLAIVNHRKHIESTFLVSGRLRLAKMLLSMRIQLSVDRGPEAPRATGKDVEEHDPEDHDMTEP